MLVSRCRRSPGDIVVISVDPHESDDPDDHRVGIVISVRDDQVGDLIVGVFVTGLVKFYYDWTL